MKCPTCGGEKRLHPESLWKAHQKMHEAYKEIQDNIKRINKRRNYGKLLR